MQLFMAYRARMASLIKSAKKAMVIVIALGAGVIFGLVVSSNPLLAVICGAFFGTIAWALTGYKTASSSTSSLIDDLIVELSDIELVQKIRVANKEEREDLDVEAAGRQVVHAKEKEKNLTMASLFPNGESLVITEKAFAKADAGDVDAQALIGISYLTGTSGLPQNLYKAGLYLLKAAEQGHGMSCLSMATIYLEGLGGSADDLDKARFLAFKAKHLGIPEADAMLQLIDQKRSSLADR